MPLPRTTALILSPVAAAICCAATSASNEVRLSAPSRCSMNKRIPSLIIPLRLRIADCGLRNLEPRNKTEDEVQESAIRNPQSNHSRVEAQFLDKLGGDFGGFA